MDSIHATLRPLDLPQHTLEVMLELPADLMATGPVLAIPAWTPGSYLVRDHARFVDRVALVDASGTRHPVSKLDKQRWALPVLEGSARLSYRLYANELSVRTNHADPRHAHLVGAATFLFPEAEPHRSWRLTFEGWPEGWRVATPLDAADGAYLAEDRDTLVDTPFELGTFRLHAWEQEGVHLALALTGESCADETRIAEGIRRIVDVSADLFGGLPFRRYLFLLTFNPGSSGGLEHRTSTSLLADPHAFEGPEGYHDLMTLVAHEFFHVWSVKRMRPAELVPLDYRGEQPTRLLWFFEGLTNFMQYGLAGSAGVLPWSWTVRELASFWTDFTTRAGRLEQSLEEASFDAWIRTYKPTEASTNTGVSYYGKGTVVGWLMDAQLRLASEGKTGLQDYFRLLWSRHGDGPVRDEDLRVAFRDLGGDPEPLWRAWIQGTEELDPAPIEQAYGLELQRLAPWELLDGERAQDEAFSMRARLWTGIVWDGSGARIRSVIPGSPACLAGLTYGMEVIAVQGWRTSAASEAQARLGDGVLGQSMSVLAADRGRVAEYRLVLAENPARITRVVSAKEPSEAQRRAFLGWTGLEHPACRRRILR